MKHITHIHRTALLSLLTLGFGASALQAQEPEDIEKSDPFTAVAIIAESKTPNEASALQAQEPEDIEKSDPFTKVAIAVAVAKTPNDQGAEMLDAQARILFARGETEKAIALQTQAVEKAKNTIDKFSETLDKYHGKSTSGETLRMLEKIIIPQVAFKNMPLTEAIEFVGRHIKRFNATEPDFAKKEIRFVHLHLHTDPRDPLTKCDYCSPVIKDLQLRNVSLSVLLKNICTATNQTYSIEHSTITLVSKH